MFVEGVQPFLDGLYVIVDAAGRFATLQQTPGHCFVTNLEVQNLRAGTDFLFKFFSLSDFTWIPVIGLEYIYLLFSILIMVFIGCQVFKGGEQNLPEENY